MVGACFCACCRHRDWAANELSSRRPREAYSQPLSQLLNALLESQGGWDVHSCKCSSYLDKRLS